MVGDLLPRSRCISRVRGYWFRRVWEGGLERKVRTTFQNPPASTGLQPLTALTWEGQPFYRTTQRYSVWGLLEDFKSWTHWGRRIFPHACFDASEAPTTKEDQEAQAHRKPLAFCSSPRVTRLPQSWFTGSQQGQQRQVGWCSHTMENSRGTQRAKLHEQPRSENRACEGEGRNQSGFSGQVTQWLWQEMALCGGFRPSDLHQCFAFSQITPHKHTI